LISRSPGYLLAGFVMLAALPATAQEEGGGVAANQELRIQQLESEIRGLTGQVEDLSYQVRSLTDQLQKLVSDTDFRLREIEGGGAGGTTGSAAPSGGEQQPALGEPTGTAPQAAEANPPPPQPAEPANPPLAAVGGGTNQPSTGVGQPRTLGTMSETDFEAQKSKLKSADAAAASAAAGQAANQANNQAGAPTGQGQTAAVPSGGTPDEQYQNAFSLLRATKYNEAEKALKSFIAQYPDHPLTGNANYWLGETYYVRADYNNAALTFAEGYKKYPKSGKAPDNLLKLGMSLAALGERDDACKALTELDSRYPNANDNVKQRAAKERQRNGC
jgi:tol-pal system protein YbgF